MKINVFRIAITLDDSDDEGVEGIYSVQFADNHQEVSKAKLASMALDVFASTIPIASLDDFTISVIDDNDEPIEEDESHDSYSFKGRADIEKIEDVALDLFDEDATLSADQLDAKYNQDGDGEHPTVTRAHWSNAISSQETASGYWDWVQYKLNQLKNQKQTIE